MKIYIHISSKYEHSKNQFFMDYGLTEYDTTYAYILPLNSMHILPIIPSCCAKFIL